MDAALAVFTRAAYYCNDTGACKRFNSIFYFSPLPPLQKKKNLSINLPQRLEGK